MPISLAQLEAFAALAECGSFGKTAERLGVTQPAVTQHVAKLGRHFNLKLVDVVRHRPLLTEAGRFLAERARSVVGGVALLESEMADFAHVRSGTLEIGATVTVGTYVLPGLIAEFRSVRPAASVRVQIANTAVINELVRRHTLGLGLIEGAPPDDLVTTPFRDDELVLVVPARAHRLSRRRRVRASDLANEPFISREIGSGTRDLGYDTLQTRGIRPPVALELPSGEAILRAVEAGLGIAILSRLVVDRDARNGMVRVLAIDDLPLRRSFHLVRAADRTLSPAQAAFERLVLRS